MSTPTSREAIEKLLYEKVTSYQAVNYEELTDALLKLQQAAVVAARYDELSSLSYINARNDWHNDSAYKLWEYVAGRQAQLKQQPAQGDNHG